MNHEVSGKRILIIDDEQLFLDLLSHLLARLGYQVDQASDGREALRILEAQTYDVIFLDMKMPFMDGKEFFIEIRRKCPALSERIVFVTGDIANAETMSFIHETGNGCLQKPFTIKEVEDLLNRLFQGR